ncbi:MAG: non-histone chromosomal MC1 family protein [archaeon]
MGEKRYFVLMNKPGGTEKGVFTGRTPRQAALKAATQGETDFYLYERGTRPKKYHHFTGKREKVPAPENRPAWMPEKVWKATVKKVGIVKEEKKKPKKK